MADHETRGSKADQGAHSAKSRWTRSERWAVVAVAVVVVTVVCLFVAGDHGWLGSNNGIRSAAVLVGAVAWPVVVGGVLIFVLVAFREQIGGLIDRVDKVRFPGGELSAPSQALSNAELTYTEDLQALAEGGVASVAAEARGPTPEVTAHAVVAEMEATGHAVVPEAGVAAHEPSVTHDEPVSADEMTLAARLLATKAERDELRRKQNITTVQLELERIYGQIYGSQVRSLRAIQSAEPEGLTRAGVEQFYASAPTLIRASVAFDVWLQFLTARGLITATADGHYHLSLKGRALLLMIDANPALFPEKTIT